MKNVLVRTVTGTSSKSFVVPEQKRKKRKQNMQGEKTSTRKCSRGGNHKHHTEIISPHLFIEAPQLQNGGMFTKQQSEAGSRSPAFSMKETMLHKQFILTTSRATARMSMYRILSLNSETAHAELPPT